MKKIILAALTVLMMFGLIGCSGVLHDKAALDISGFAVVGPNGSWDGTQRLTKVSDTEFYFEFVAKGETEQVSLQLVPGSWDTRYCGDDNGTQKEIIADDKESSATMVYYEGGDPKHMLMKGLTADCKYKITFKVNAANEIVVSVVSAGKVVLPEPFLLDGLVVTTDALGPKPTLDGILLSPKVEDTLVGDATYKVSFKATDTKNTFAITDVDETVKYTFDKDIEVGKTVELKKAGDKDKATNFTGLKIGALYELTITTTPAGTVKVSLAEICKVTVKLNIIGFPVEAEGMTAYVDGNFSDWKKGWTTAWGGKAKVSEGYSAVIKDGEATIDIFTDKITELNSEVSIEGCGYYGEVKDDDIAESKGDIKIEENNFKTSFKADMAATWVITVDLSGKTCTAAKE